MVTLSDLVGGLAVAHLDAGTNLRSRDLEGACLLFVEQGLVVVRSAARGSTRRTITCHAGTGSLLLPPEEDEVLVSLTDVLIVPLSAAALDRLVESPAAARLLVERLSATLRQKHAALTSMSRLHHVDRVREKLIELAREHGRVGRDGIRLDFPLTHDLLGEMTGSARETVTRALDELQREGFVVRRGRTYSVHVAPEELLSAVH